MYSYLRLHIVARPVGRPPTSTQGPSGLHSLVAMDQRQGQVPSPLLRRVLGKALVDLFCPYGEPRCQPRRGQGHPAPVDHCNLAKTCPYGVLFAASSSARPPFALYVLPNRGPDLNLELTLYGPGWRLYPWALSGLQRAFQQGLGKRRQRWQIKRVLRVAPAGGRVPLCGTDVCEVPSTLEPDRFGLTAQCHLAPRPVEIQLLSPTRLIRDGRLLRSGSPVPFEVLVARSLDRFRGLYGDQASDLLRRPIRDAIEQDAAEVPLISDRTRWIEVKDYSARSRTEMYLGGRVGRLVYSEEATRFLPLLQAGEILHLGKNATAGCGRIRVGPTPDL